MCRTEKILRNIVMHKQAISAIFNLRLECITAQLIVRVMIRPIRIFIIARSILQCFMQVIRSCSGCFQLVLISGPLQSLSTVVQFTQSDDKIIDVNT